MTALWATILVSSVAGSLHCVGMCGPLVGLHGGARSLRLALIHALGRLTTYALLGGIAGLVGQAVDLAGRMATVQHVASIVAGGVIVAWGLRSIALAMGWLTERATRNTLFTRGLTQIRSKRAASRAWLVGVLTGFLPCGWLWAFVVSAAGTASPWTGAAVMFLFWLGTVPAMTGVLTFAGPVIERVRRKLPVISATVMIALGLATLAMRWDKVPAAAGEPPAPACHHQDMP